jgi:hypothetical protein
MDADRQEWKRIGGPSSSSENDDEILIIINIFIR